MRITDIIYTFSEVNNIMGSSSRALDQQAETGRLPWTCREEYIAKNDKSSISGQRPGGNITAHREMESLRSCRTFDLNFIRGS